MYQALFQVLETQQQTKETKPSHLMELSFYWGWGVGRQTEKEVNQ